MYTSNLLPITFFFSGFCALVYQLCWQRYLGSALGVDIDSTTIVVSVFMLGIGIGGGLGGWIGDTLPRYRSLIYSLAEFLIGIYALLSLRIFDWAVSPGNLMGNQNHIQNALGGFIILVIPTIMMGITLPLLTLILNQKISNIGYSVGTLYFINTFGAAFGTLIATFFLFNYFSLSITIKSMAAINIAISAAAVYVFKKESNL